ncbi:cyclic nucleotide-binding domain-containing protein [Myxococcota bacterium]|nr:cyclic nucleotide-binding domain-containing protein [Myxococcota bacterium]
MDLLQRLPPAHRERLVGAAVTFRLGRGEVLLRRGERGGDVYRVAEGQLEIIDSRVDPPVVLDRVGTGAFVGEMSFLDEEMRSADVRAAEETVCQHWARDRLLAMLAAEPDLGHSFYRALAELVNERSRGFRAMALSGGIGGRGGRAGAPALSPQASFEETEQQLLDALRRRLMEAEPRARLDRRVARVEVHEALDRFTEGLRELLARLGREQAEAALRRVRHELHPYLVRSHLAELSLVRPRGHSGDPEALRHLLEGRAEGDGALGELLDEWLLALPTARGLRDRHLRLAQEARARMEEPGRLLLLHTAATGGARRLLEAAGPRWACTLVEAEVELLGAPGLLPPGSWPRVELRHEDLAAVALGDARLELGQHDLVVVEGLLDYLPDRPAATLLAQLRAACAPGATLLLAGLGPSADSGTWNDLLEWPTVRRTAGSLPGLARRCGFSEVQALPCEGAGLLLRAQAP